MPVVSSRRVETLSVKWLDRVFLELKMSGAVFWACWGVQGQVQLWVDILTVKEARKYQKEVIAGPPELKVCTHRRGCRAGRGAAVAAWRQQHHG